MKNPLTIIAVLVLLFSLSAGIESDKFDKLLQLRGTWAMQTKKGRKMRNDRLIAVADKMPSLAHYRNLKDVPESVIAQIEHFFVSYNKAEGKTFTPIGRADAARAKRLVREGEKKFREKFGE